MQTTDGSAATDDVVARWGHVGSADREPLLVLESLTGFLDEHGLGHGPVVPEPIGEGHSNITYRLRRTDSTLVLRRPPRPPFPPSAHDVLREARVMGALQGSPVPVPKVLARCEDLGVIGAPFYVVEHIEGPVVSTAMPVDMDDQVSRRRAGEALIDTLIALGQVDWRAAGLEGFGREGNYLERQLARFGGLWQRNQTRSLPVVDAVYDWLMARVPESGPTTIVHGDFRLGNMILDPDPPLRIAGVLDWEMSTLGDPLADLGYLLALWPEAGDPSLGAFELGGLTRKAGFCTRAELAERYALGTGGKPADVSWYMVLALWKLAVLMEGNFRRAQEGTTDDRFLAGFGDGVVLLAERAQALTGA
jgi:aminoglycoside phosphotransferase (APT) family kinase protein